MQKINIPDLKDIQFFRNNSSIDISSAQLKKYRDDAQLRYVHLPNPTNKDEDWRFIQLPEIAWDQLHLSDAYIPKTKLENGAFVCDLRDVVHLEDIKALTHPSHKASEDRSCLSNIASGVGGNLLKERANKNVFSTFVDASWNRGVMIYIPKNISFDQAIDLQSIVPVYDSDLLIEKVVIIIESGAHVHIKDVLRSIKTKVKIVIRAVDIIMQDNAQLTFVHDQDWDKTVQEISTTHCILEHNSKLNYYALITGGMLTKSWFDVLLNGEHARAKVRGAYLLHEKQYMDINSMQKHIAHRATSDVFFKGALSGAAQSVYRGTIFIDKKAHNTDAIQKNKNILLNSVAHAYSIPNLEVLTNDVQCAHGSAVGQLDADQLFYAQARGLSAEQAQQILLEGFFNDLFESNNTLLISKRIQKLLPKKCLN